jgi:CRISPR-associated protein Cas1
MNELPARDLKAILHSKRANMYYLEHCRVLVNGGRVEYVTEQGKDSLYWNIPIANTTTILLGTGTSITQAAVRELAKAGVMLGFVGGGGTPLFAGTDIEWMSPQSEYRPTEYLQQWVRFWFHEDLRLAAARRLQLARLDRISSHWPSIGDRYRAGFTFDRPALASLLRESALRVERATDVEQLLVEEARVTRGLYKFAVDATSYGDFVREKHGAGVDRANSFLDHGNYLAYGLGATAAWVAGVPPSLAVLHGKTRKGGLVFDLADLVKDAVVLPQAFLSARNGDDEQEFRVACIENLTRNEALDFMIDTLKSIAASVSAEEPSR